MISSYLILSSSEVYHHLFCPLMELIAMTFRARRNDDGHLEPDADDETVAAASGFSEYETIKVQRRTEPLASTSTATA